MDDTVSPKLYELLKAVVNEDIVNFTLRIHGSNKKGEGFMGDFVYVSLKNKNTDEVLEVVVKQAYGDENIRKLQPVGTYYTNEINFYTKVWPRLDTFQTEVLSTKIFDKIPMCFAATTEDKNEKIVLENLRHQNFKTIEKWAALDEQHLEFIFKQYGKFHAISFAYKALNPQGYSEIAQNVKELYGTVAETGLKHIIEVLAELCLKNLALEKNDEITEKFRQYSENMTQIFCNRHIYEGKYSAILHGDCWTNNMMFKYDELGNVTDIRLFDFQFAKEGTPVSDLSYCLYSGAPKEILDKLDYYLRVYHNSLSETLKEFGCNADDVYPFQELKNDWKQYCKTGFTMGLFIWRLKLTHDNDVIDLTDRGKNSEKTMVTTEYDEETFKIRSRDLILHMYENDFL